MSSHFQPFYPFCDPYDFPEKLNYRSQGAEGKARNFYTSCINKKKNFTEYWDEATEELKKGGLNKTFSDFGDLDDIDNDESDDLWGWSHWEKYYPNIRLYTQPFFEDKGVNLSHLNININLI